MTILSGRKTPLTDYDKREVAIIRRDLQQALNQLEWLQEDRLDWERVYRFKKMIRECHHTVRKCQNAIKRIENR